MHGLIFETSICYWQSQPGCYHEKIGRVHSPKTTNAAVEEGSSNYLTSPQQKVVRPSVFFQKWQWGKEQDRKSVVKGKSVSVSVDLGGGSIFKKKTTKQLSKNNIR